MGMISTNDARRVYAAARKTLQDSGVDVKAAKLTPSYLRFEAKLNRTETQYSFPIVVTQQGTNTTQSPTEQRLQLQDSFFISHIQYAIQIYTGTGVGDLYRYVPFTYPSNLGNVDGAFGSYGAYRLWGGYLRFTINNDVVLTGWDCYRHLYVPQTQNQAWINPFPISQFFNAYDEYDGSQDGYYPMEPNIVLIGSRNNELNLILPESLGTAIGTGSTDVRAIITVRGVLAQNSTTVR